jgi:hypothetical protein
MIPHLIFVWREDKGVWDVGMGYRSRRAVNALFFQTVGDVLVGYCASSEMIVVSLLQLLGNTR